MNIQPIQIIFKSRCENIYGINYLYPSIFFRPPAISIIKSFEIEVNTLLEKLNLIEIKHNIDYIINSEANLFTIKFKSYQFQIEKQTYLEYLRNYEYQLDSKKLK